MVGLIKSSEFVFESNKELGALEIPTFVSLVLLGVSLSQGYTYFQRSEGDRLALKLLVSTLLLLEIFHSFTASHSIYFETVTRWNRGGEANSYPLSICVLSENIITFIVQCFFSHRIYRLSQKLPLSILCFIFSLLRFAGGIGLSVESILDVPRTPNGDFVFTFSWLITSALAVGATADVLIAISMLYYLRKLDSGSNLKSTTAVLNRLVRWTLQTGLITSMTSVAVIICFQAMVNMVWLGLYIILAKIYSISLLVSLNARPQRGVSNLTRKISTSDLQFESPIPVSVSFQNAQGDMPLWSPVYPQKFSEV